MTFKHQKCEVLGHVASMLQMYAVVRGLLCLLQGGVWYQRCYDPDCRDYRSETMPLPLALIRCV